MSLIKCECGNEFLGQKDKEDTCPDCLKKLINPDMKGYMDLTNVCLTNRKFKNFEYDTDELKENPCIEFTTEVKVNALNFFRVIEYLNKNNSESLNLRIENRRLIISSTFDVVRTEFNIDSVSCEGEIGNCNYSVEYLKAFLKEYKIKELEEFIVLKFAEEYPLLIELKADWMVLAPRDIRN